MTDSVETRTIRSGDILKEKYMQKQRIRTVRIMFLTYFIRQASFQKKSNIPLCRP